MRRTPNLRQIEAFKAVIECGTVSRAAEVLHITQPAVSKLLAHLEDDTELQLFERAKGRLVPSAKGLRLYEEIDRVFAGVKQISRAVELIKQEELGRISVGVMPALSGPFISSTSKHFLASNPDAYVTVIIRSSQFIVEWLLSKQVDIGIINRAADRADIECLPLLAGNFVCILPLGHALARKAVIEATDIEGVPFVGLGADNRIRHKIDNALKEHGVAPNYIMDATLAPSVCEMVASGIGISILDPMFAFGQKDRLAIRRFEPRIDSDLTLCWLRGTQNHLLVESYVEAARATVKDMLEAIPVSG